MLTFSFKEKNQHFQEIMIQCGDNDIKFGLKAVLKINISTRIVFHSDAVNVSINVSISNLS